MKPITSEKVTLSNLFSHFKTSFVIPDFQRPYVWDETLCEELWEDLIQFALPDNGKTEFNRNDSYFLGTIITYPDEEQRGHVVDGHQRITTLSLLMRALFDALDDSTTKKVAIGKCIWAFDELDQLNKSVVKIDNQMMFDEFKNSFLNILVTGSAPKALKDNYANNFRWFKNTIRKMKAAAPSSLELFASRLLDNVEFVHMVCDNINDALHLFFVVNAKGTPLSPTDVFKAKLCDYKLKTQGLDAKTEIAKTWQSLTERSEKVFKKSKKAVPPLEFLFFLHASAIGVKATLSNFSSIYSAQNDALLKDPKTLETLSQMLDFFLAVKGHKTKFFVSDKALRYAYILYKSDEFIAWLFLAKFFIASIYNNSSFDVTLLEQFLERLLACTVGANVAVDYSNLGYNTLIYEKRDFILNASLDNVRKFSAASIREQITHFYESPMPIKRARRLLWWWTFKDDSQPLYTASSPVLQIEHIFSKSLAENRIFNNANNIELPGNLALLESSLNNKGTNFGFDDKSLLYRGLGTKKLNPTFNNELRLIAETQNDFDESDILLRNQRMLNAVLEFLDAHQLLEHDSIR